MQCFKHYIRINNNRNTFYYFLNRHFSNNNISYKLLKNIKQLDNYNSINLVTSKLKDIAYINNKCNLDLSKVLLPKVEHNYNNINNDNSADWLWSLGRLGFTADNPRHKIICESLISKLCSVIKPNTRQMATSFGGLSKLNIKWAYLNSSQQSRLLLLVESIANELDSRAVSNILHSMSSLGIRWNDLPQSLQQKLFNAITTNNNDIDGSSQYNGRNYLTTAVRGLALMDVRWDELPSEVPDNITAALSSKALTSQELSSIMYSVALLSFDCHDTSSNDDSDGDRRGMQQLREVHNIILTAYNNLVNNSIENRQIERILIYFETLQTLPYGSQLITSILSNNGIPTLSTQSNEPSQLHSSVSTAMNTYLQQYDVNFSVFNEFEGLNGVFPIDCAVYYNNDIVAFVEIDGRHHYRAVNSLRRKDRLKEFLYSSTYSGVPLYRVRYDQINIFGADGAAQTIAATIVKLVDKE